jgi:hypothetical protein
MKPIPSTAEILAFKALGRSVDKKWTDWAYNMLEAGFETENLTMLAGELPPYNQFELQALTDKVFAELNLKWNDRDEVVKNYVCYLVAQTLSADLQASYALNMIKDICVQLDYEPGLNDFYLLYYAWDDLRYSEQQWYWDGATRENIEQVIKDYFKEWIVKCDY